jgi:hypothetical protein
MGEGYKREREREWWAHSLSLYCFDFFPALPASLLGVALGDLDRLRADVVVAEADFAAVEDFLAGAFFVVPSSSACSSSTLAAGAATTFLLTVLATLALALAAGLPPFDAAGCNTGGEESTKMKSGRHGQQGKGAAVNQYEA